MTAVVQHAFARHLRAVEDTMATLLPAIERTGTTIAEALADSHKVLVCGNGGSAADSQHFAAECVVRFRAHRRALPAVALTVDSSVLTAGGNDLGFDALFSRQVSALGAAGDVLVAISTSGGSPNVICALRTARELGLRSILLTGGGDAAAAREADEVIAVPCTETARIQEVHGLILHVWCEMLDLRFAGR